MGFMLNCSKLMNTNNIAWIQISSVNEIPRQSINITSINYDQPSSTTTNGN